MKYNPPEIINSYDLELENELLAGSVVTEEVNSSVETVGQEVVEIDASSFTSNWE